MMARISSGARNVDADLELALAASLDASIPAATPQPSGAQGAHDVLRHEAALLRVIDDGAERAEDCTYQRV
jgi:hypothetical protein